MERLRRYGSGPFKVAVIHGGPGAPGEMAPVARELSSLVGVLEPLQTATSLEGQVQELYDVLLESGGPPFTLIGWSWGAWLAYIYAAEYPALAGKIVLVDSGPFEERYASRIMEVRLDRLGGEEAAEVLSLMETLSDPRADHGETDMARFGELILRADSYDPLPHHDEVLHYRYDSYRDIWEQARLLRSSGELLEMGRKISCPVVAIHGDFDPHPFEGVRDPLRRVVNDFRFILLRNCGHQPWIERYARDEFYRILKEELP